MKIKTYKISTKEEVDQLKEQDSINSLWIVFGNNKELISEIQKQTERAQMVGCYSSDNILHKEMIGCQTLSVATIVLDKTKVKTFYLENTKYEDSFKVGQKLWDQCNQGGNELSGILVLSKSVDINGPAIADGLNYQNFKQIPIIGGLAGEDLSASETLVFDNNKLSSTGTLAVAFYGSNFKIAMGSKSGMKSFGVERKVTKSVKNIVQEIDGLPALDVYEKLLGKHFDPTKAIHLNFPIEIGSTFNFKGGVIRTPLKLCREEKWIGFGSEVPQGSYFRLMLAMTSELIQAANEVDDSVPQIEDSLSLIVSCAARRRVMGAETFLEIPQKRENQIGFYSYGEFTSISSSCELVNQTFTQGILYETV